MLNNKEILDAFEGCEPESFIEDEIEAGGEGTNAD
jgi:hypothetical protein